MAMPGDTLPCCDRSTLGEAGGEATPVAEEPGEWDAVGEGRLRSDCGERRSEGLREGLRLPVSAQKHGRDSRCEILCILCPAASQLFDKICVFRTLQGTLFNTCHIPVCNVFIACGTRAAKDERIGP